MQTPSDLNDMISLCLMNEALKMIIFCKYLLLAQKCRYITCTHKKLQNIPYVSKFGNIDLVDVQ